MNALLEVKGVTKKFGGLVANNDISFDVAENEILSVIGPNGAGKSTLFKMISSFLPTTAGEVTFRGERISNLKPHVVARKGVVRTFQETTIFKSMTVRKALSWPSTCAPRHHWPGISGDRNRHRKISGPLVSMRTS